MKQCVFCERPFSGLKPQYGLSFRADNKPIYDLPLSEAQHFPVCWICISENLRLWQIKIAREGEKVNAH